MLDNKVYYSTNDVHLFKHNIHNIICYISRNNIAPIGRWYDPDRGNNAIVLEPISLWIALSAHRIVTSKYNSNEHRFVYNTWENMFGVMEGFEQVASKINYENC